MAEFFTDEADAALETWLAPVTWDSDHWADEGRFYRFVAALARRREWDAIGPKLMEAVEHYHPDVDKDSVKDRVFEMAHNARIVFNYLEAQQHTI